jgi:hypothetical protein
MSSVFDTSAKETYERMTRQEVEMARHIRDTIAKSDDTKNVYKMLMEMQKVYESRVLLDSGEGRHPDGRVYTLEDFWTNVGEVRGLRWLATKVKAMISKAEEADKEDRKRREGEDK